MKLVVGCGYLGSRVAGLWHARGEQVVVITRSAERAREFEQGGFRPLVADVTDPASLDRLRSFADIDGVLFAVGYARGSGKSRQEVYVGGLANLLAALPPDVRRFIYISTTGVYGQTDGSWVDEDSPCEPSYDGGRIVLEAESLLHGSSMAGRAIVLRMAGIYGPGRIPRREDLAKGTPLRADPQAYLNLIHVDDAAGVVVAVASQVEPPRTYLVSDGNPVVRVDYYTEAARLIGAPSPKFAAPAMRGSPDERGNTNKRVHNAHLVNEIGYQFLYPTYREGLKASTGSS